MIRTDNQFHDLANPPRYFFSRLSLCSLVLQVGPCHAAICCYEKEEAKIQGPPHCSTSVVQRTIKANIIIIVSTVRRIIIVADTRIIVNTRTRSKNKKEGARQDWQDSYGQRLSQELAK